ncbi:DUF1737 domain-containing protein [Dinoroseobacter sp. S76]|uniref:DUF1737 domain-containing protein n=1 Tax=Dinoroseobacter sp. S76 TaxID=3415124 RepID=UPI003C7A742A
MKSRYVSDYKIVVAKSYKNLEQDVKKEISGGWEPIGGVSIAVNNIWGQAMVRYITTDS